VLVLLGEVSDCALGACEKNANEPGRDACKTPTIYRSDPGLAEKNKTLKESLTPSQLEYMMVRLARRQASILANDFTLITHERPKTTHKLIFGYLLLLTCPSFCFFLVLPIAAFLSFLFPLPIPLQVPVGLQER
jgi:hypothetical protein